MKYKLIKSTDVLDEEIVFTSLNGEEVIVKSNIGWSPEEVIKYMCENNFSWNEDELSDNYIVNCCRKVNWM
jgi:tRNA(Ile)-lysidine synthase TilS/MesJ